MIDNDKDDENDDDDDDVILCHINIPNILYPILSYFTCKFLPLSLPLFKLYLARLNARSSSSH